MKSTLLLTTVKTILNNNTYDNTLTNTEDYDEERKERFKVKS